ncbi:MalY/PatB family protein [Enterococcus xiangfangensis]|uniref:MalY/PatB family protein n=1 Tax=Enterococcus xiangfangensis TaxID=1296537 RepID=UPI003D18368C|nr:pyridoxal phosphate-dependent aminotransferase [Enterococcus asini]
MEKAEFIQNYYQQRQQTDSLKWDGLKERYGDGGLLPLWVADMDFSVPSFIQEALKQRIDHGIFGYSLVPETYFSTYQRWQKRHEQTAFQKDWLHFTTGVVQGLYDLINCFTNEGDQVIIQPPVYYPFFDAIRKQNRQLVTSELVETEDGYQMDLADFENKLITNDVKLFVLCSPHNPVGRVWNKAEIKEILRLCKENDVLVISDEIHSDLILPGHSFVSAVTVAEELDFLDHLIVCNAPSKTFNLAALLNAHIWLPDKKLQKKYQTWESIHRQTENSLLGQLAGQTAYDQGDEWLQSLLTVIGQNYQLLKKQLAENIPEIKIHDLQGTYLAWLDLRNWLSTVETKQFIQEQAGLAIDYGEWFSPETKGFIRINLATSPDNIESTVKRLIAVNRKIKGGN